MKIRGLNIVDSAEAAQVLALQRRSYRLEAALIGTDDIPPLRESLTNLQSSGETFFGAFEGERLCGAIAYKVIGDTLDLHRVMVDPQFLRRGIASALIGFVKALEFRTLRTIVSTGSRNEPGRQLYARLGFVEIGEREVAPGLFVTAFERTKAAIPTKP
ncbi:hypothetical protein GCM10011611_46420 [Aliidongia dinghuensis]|uniref:N-acetyltransferase domain-containing protein n=1 Tax=Aliidongia dinghuensis TaxID=1867774 RepID=A0A8J2YZ70_9PROT|nr:GNAT family N-acetyltransferase [Aliidongia dinghuensis]GGF34916.1 hypothetical protein GCM10011611_46420 [Aliidongia dinghuensis]